MHPLLALLFLVPPLWGLVVAVQDRDRARAHLWAGAAWAVAYLALTAPAILFQGFQMRPELVLPGQQLDRTAELAFYAALWAVVFATSGAAFAWNVVVGATAAAQWHAMAAWGEREGASGGPFAPRWLGWAFGLGVAAAVLSWSAFEYLGVADSGFLASLQPTLPGLQAGPPWAVVLFAVLYVLSLALYEELLLRGVLLGNLLRNVGGSPAWQRSSPSCTCPTRPSPPPR